MKTSGNLRYFWWFRKNADSVPIGSSTENLIRNASHCISWKNMWHVSVHLNAEWKQHDGDLAHWFRSTVQVELTQAEIHLCARFFSLIPHSLFVCVPFFAHLQLWICESFPSTQPTARFITFIPIFQFLCLYANKYYLHFVTEREPAIYLAAEGMNRGSHHFY